MGAGGPVWRPSDRQEPPAFMSRRDRLGWATRNPVEECDVDHTPHRRLMAGDGETVQAGVFTETTELPILKLSLSV